MKITSFKVKYRLKKLCCFLLNLIPDGKRRESCDCFKWKEGGVVVASVIVERRRWHWVDYPKFKFVRLWEPADEENQSPSHS